MIAFCPSSLASFQRLTWRLLISPLTLSMILLRIWVNSPSVHSLVLGSRLPYKWSLLIDLGSEITAITNRSVPLQNQKSFIAKNVGNSSMGYSMDLHHAWFQFILFKSPSPMRKSNQYTMNKLLASTIYESYRHLKWGAAYLQALPSSYLIHTYDMADSLDTLQSL